MKIDNFKIADGPFIVGTQFALIAQTKEDLHEIMELLGIPCDPSRSMPLGFAPLKAFSKP